MGGNFTDGSGRIETHDHPRDTSRMIHMLALYDGSQFILDNTHAIVTCSNPNQTINSLVES